MAFSYSDNQFLSEIAKEVALLVEDPAKMEYFRQQLKVFGDKWKAWEIAHEADRQGNWQPSMGKPGNPLGVIWYCVYGSGWPDLRSLGSGHRGILLPLHPKDVPTILGDYAILAVVHDKKLPQCNKINNGYLPTELAQEMWNNLETGIDLEGETIVPGRSPSPRSVIRKDKIRKSLNRVKDDLKKLSIPEENEHKVIRVLSEYEGEHVKKDGMAPDGLEREAEMTWWQIRPVLNSLGDKELIEMYKGKGSLKYWHPVQFDDKLDHRHRKSESKIWKFRLTQKGRELGAELVKRSSSITLEKSGLPVRTAKMDREKLALKEPAETEQEVTPAKRCRIWTCVKRIPRWIYILVLFFAALLTIFHLLGCLEPIRAFIYKVLWP